MQQFALLLCPIDRLEGEPEKEISRKIVQHAEAQQASGRILQIIPL